MSTARGRGPLGLALILLCTVAAMAPAAALAASASTTLPIIEREVMCVTCKIPLAVAESAQAERERLYIQSLINEGKNDAQVKATLISQYGPSVIATPSTHGFDITAYLVPLAVVLGLLGTLAMLLPAWRRHARMQAKRVAAAPTLDASETARLDADLARFD